MEKYPDAKEAFLDRKAAKKDRDIGIENASPESIRQALKKARCSMEEAAVGFTMDDMMDAGLVGGSDSSARRQKLGKILGIGYGNGKIFLQRLNKFGVTREEFEKALQEM